MELERQKNNFMKDKYLYLILGALIVGNVVLTIRNIKSTEVPNEVGTRNVKMSDIKDNFTIMNVLPVNKDKELKDPEEVRQYVLEMARREKLNVAMVDKIGYCESRWRYDAVSRTGKYQGVWQISEIHKLGDDRLDVVKSTRWSLDKMKREGYGAWECSKI